ncbi:hypothetical protein M431DRAFT_440310 [Trichoderma harzianum CBS 226.95]|uniref:Uncharacterized protein n=2 Tax=Trichoderma harzianum CBS 226.95 TaxID=983964 RepID=A0A2T3ZRE2_TRIHA|nr:hypothetical protein M431DRAFT_440310 [Trichoderma harzianum CBS 226.95]PTB47369.1 hypothetical protein M431DRAFT_440310 [Trichoderma harzianum CBS 226.95]
METMGEMGDPCGAPHSSSVSGRVVPYPFRTRALRSLMKESTHFTKRGGQPCSLSLYTRRLRMTMSNAPEISSVRREMTRPWARATSASCSKQATRSVADLFGRAPKYCSGSILCSIARRETLLARSLSRPLPIQESREMGL